MEKLTPKQRQTINRITAVLDEKPSTVVEICDISGLSGTVVRTALSKMDVSHTDDGRFYLHNPRTNIDETPTVEEVLQQVANADLTEEVKQPSFKVGEKVYCPIIGKQIFDVKNHSSSLAYPLLVGGLHINTEGYFHQDGVIVLYHATSENYEMLCKRYPHIDFEKPPITGNELCRALLDKGEKFIIAKDDTDTWRIICDYCDDWFTDVVTGKCLKNVTPVNSKGEPLTEAVLQNA